MHFRNIQQGYFYRLNEVRVTRTASRIASKKIEPNEESPFRLR